MRKGKYLLAIAPAPFWFAVWALAHNNPKWDWKLVGITMILQAVLLLTVAAKMDSTTPPKENV